MKRNPDVLKRLPGDEDESAAATSSENSEALVEAPQAPAEESAAGTSGE